MKRIVITMQKNLEYRLGGFSKKMFFNIILGVFVFSNLHSQNGEALFKQSCSACHSVGGGRLVGPDLIGINTKRKEDWLLKFVKASQSFIKSGDADAKAIFDQYQIVMPDQNISDADIKSIIAYIGSKSPVVSEVVATDTKAAEQVTPQGKTSSDATAEEIALGQNLFEGRSRFSAGGPSCLSCHNIEYDAVMGGGLLAKDLTTVHSRLGGDAGVKGILGAPPFPAMTQSYLNKPLTDDEIFAITAFLAKVDKDKIYQHPKSTSGLLIGGLVGFALALCVIYILWYYRKRKSVKDDILNRQIKSI